MYKKTSSSIRYSELAPLTCDVTCSKFYRDRENITDQKFSVGLTPDIINQQRKSLRQ